MLDLIKEYTNIKLAITEAAEKARRNPAGVKLVAVGKGQPASALQALAEAGQIIFGESYLQEAANKIKEVSVLNLSWHFIGHVQTNKVKQVVSLFSCVESVDSLKLAQSLNKAALEINKKLKILVQVNLAGETSKSGCNTRELSALCQAIAQFPNLQLKGLMTLPPFFDAPEKSRPYFAELNQLAKELNCCLPPGSMDELSMGMSGDFQVAIEEGATLVRIGTALFGSRN